jgi:hypothetical protein
MKKLLYTALLINAVLLTGCQVTGEKTGLYQKILGGSFATGVDTKAMPLFLMTMCFQLLYLNLNLMLISLQKG